MNTFDEILGSMRGDLAARAESREAEAFPVAREVFELSSRKRSVRAHWTLERGAFSPTWVVFNKEPVALVSDTFFDHPGAPRAHQLCATLLNENRDPNTWRSPRATMSVAEEDEEETETDWFVNVGVGTPTAHLMKVARLVEREEIRESTKAVASRYLYELTRARVEHFEKTMKRTAKKVQHTKLVSNTFALHPMLGTGHVLRTDGRVVAFWNGEVCRVVHLSNLHMLRVVVATCGPKGRPSARVPRKVNESKVALAMDFLHKLINK